MAAMALALATSCNSGRRPLLGSGPDEATDAGTAGAGGAPGDGVTPGAGGSGGSPDAGLDAWTTPPTDLGIAADEAVTRLARVLWEEPPDSSLLAMAHGGAIKTDADVRAVATAMLADPRARVGVGHFYRWWLGLEALPSVHKDPSVFPEYSSALGAMMAKETEAFGVYTTLEGDGRFPTLMQGSYAFINETLAPLYGLSDVSGSDLQKVELDSHQRAGIFTRLAILTLNAGTDGWTAPSSRGAEVVAKMLCRDIPREPPGSPPLHPDPNHTNREVILREAGQQTCAPCHAQVDPVGFAYEGFDSLGRARSTDAGKPIDTSGRVYLSSGRVDFNGPGELAQILATAVDAHRCMGLKWLEYMLGRTLTLDDTASAEDVVGRFVASNLDLRTAIAAAASSASFLDPRRGTPCTPGADQTCNANPALSSLHGTCGPDGKCLCNAPSMLDAASGRCL